MHPKVYTIGRHLIEQERKLPGASGQFTNLLWDLAVAFKIISKTINMAGLAEMLGLTGERNIHGEAVQKLDLFAHETIYRAMDHGGHLCVMASEEFPEIIPIPEAFKKGKYVLIYDPVDGSSNIDVNVSVGTIFSILRKQSAGENGTLEDCLQPGIQQVAAGYVIYGSSTMLVYTTGQGVFGFTLDPSIGEFLLSHPEIRIAERGFTYSINEGNAAAWDEGTRRFIRNLKDPAAGDGRPYSLRYTGSLVSDVHRTLLTGGVFLYPAGSVGAETPKPKLRLLYEANPMALIMEEAGGRATTGRERILEIAPRELHEKVPLVVGSPSEVELYERCFRGEEA